ncbi:MAG: DUF2330 domain-containing protein, partial [Gemmataceae bacterium]|nr:DUF2330 domain-containing protein [Gemmataceae bacterium]
MRTLLSACLLAASIAAACRACAPVMMKGHKVEIATESALIAWDAKTKTETFVRRAKFDTATPYFGFLVPTPGVPKVDEAPDFVFTMLEDWSKREEVTETRVRYVSLFGGGSKSAMLAGEKGDRAGRGAPPPKPAVEVLDSGTVAGLDFAVLRADDKKALEEWLQKHGYDARPAVMDWLQDYIAKKWIITAFQLRKDNARATGLNTAAMRMTFKADEPFYPYREPADARPADYAGPRRFLRVFFVGDGRYAGRLDDKSRSWTGRAEYAKPLDAGRRTALAKAAPAGEGAWLTVFDDDATPRVGTGEVFFSKDPTQAELARPPIVHVRWVERTSPTEL